MKKPDRLDVALDKLYIAMVVGDKARQAEGKPLLWGDPGWWDKPKGKQ